MKKIMIFLLGALLLTGCGVGTYSVSSGKEDKSELSFTFKDKADITVTVDNDTFNIQTVKDKVYKKNRDIKKTSLNTISLTPGTHEVKVVKNGTEVFNKKLFLSNAEHKVIEL